MHTDRKINKYNTYMLTSFWQRDAVGWTQEYTNIFLYKMNTQHTEKAIRKLIRSSTYSRNVNCIFTTLQNKGIICICIAFVWIIVDFSNDLSCHPICLYLYFADCDYKGVHYENGQLFNHSDGCNECICKYGKIVCSAFHCGMFNVHASISYTFPPSISL